MKNDLYFKWFIKNLCPRIVEMAISDMRYRGDKQTLRDCVDAVITAIDRRYCNSFVMELLAIKYNYEFALHVAEIVNDELRKEGAK